MRMPAPEASEASYMPGAGGQITVPTERVDACAMELGFPLDASQGTGGARTPARDVSRMRDLGWCAGSCRFSGPKFGRFCRGGQGFR